jgi:hypothetical protein
MDDLEPLILFEKDEITYKNIYNFSDRKFLYKFNEIPQFLYYLIAKKMIRDGIQNYRAGGVYDLDAFFYNNLKFRALVQQYNTNMRNKARDYQTRAHPPIVLGALNPLTPVEIRNFLTPPAPAPAPDPGVIYGGKSMGGKSMGGQGISSNFISVNRGNSAFASNKDSRLSYYVIIDLELYPGKNGIPLAQKAVLGCQTRYEKIRQSWAKLFGLIYRPNELNVSGYVVPSPVKYKSNNKKTRKNNYNQRNTTERRR